MRRKRMTMKIKSTVRKPGARIRVLCNVWFASVLKRAPKPAVLITPDEVFSRLFRILKVKDGTAMGAINAKRISELYRSDWERCRDVCDMIKADESEALANK